MLCYVYALNYCLLVQLVCDSLSFVLLFLIKSWSYCPIGSFTGYLTTHCRYLIKLKHGKSWCTPTGLRVYRRDTNYEITETHVFSINDTIKKRFVVTVWHRFGSYYQSLARKLRAKTFDWRKALNTKHFLPPHLDLAHSSVVSCQLISVTRRLILCHFNSYQSCSGLWDKIVDFCSVVVTVNSTLLEFFHSRHAQQFLIWLTHIWNEQIVELNSDVFKGIHIWFLKEKNF